MHVRRLIAAAGVVALVLTGFATPAPAAAPDTPFAGDWVGNDFPPPAGDGSTNELTIGSGPAPTVVLTDDAATVCGGATLAPGTFEGRGRYDRRTGTLTVNFVRNTCDNGNRVGPINNIVFEFTGLDTITGGGADYTRP